jgi:RNA polymerase sigma factor (sigma-70 family)
MLLGVAMKYLKDKTLAADAVQQVYLKVLSDNKIADVQNCKAWLYIIMRNLCLQWLRDKNHTLSDDLLQNYTHDNHEENPDWWKTDYSLQQLELALLQLPAEQMHCISMFYLQQKSYRQIMDLHGYTYLQVKSFIQNGKRNLKNILSQKLHIPGDKR